MVQWLINLRRRDDVRLGIAEEQTLPDEPEITRAIIDSMSAFTRRTYPRGGAERAGNTKTYGVVRGTFEVLESVPEAMRHGVFAEPRTFPVWTRFAGPGPLAPADIKDNGILSIGVKLMGVEGDKLLDERHTQDFTGISAPTFTTPNIRENVKLQRQVLAGTPIFYFIGPRDSHLLDAAMQGLYSRTQSSPLEARYWSCAAYLLGDGQAMQYSIRPAEKRRTRIPLRPSHNYLREAMAHALADSAVEFDFTIQLQTDPHRMPVENGSVQWPERLSPFVTVAKLRIPPQRFDSEEQLAFAGNLAYNPWHCIAEHRPLGNQNRARRSIYKELSALRQEINGQLHIEPTGEERFD
ncbi:MAG: hypothetical protein QOJ29_3748 [Thermoleophilaceae bacterium]|nr:hypothetical protein [Thermoleophilaceae bacterium]